MIVLVYSTPFVKDIQEPLKTITISHNRIMKAIELVGEIDTRHRLRAEVPPELPAGQVRLIVLLPEEDAGENHWARGIAEEWAGDLADTRHDIYTMQDGQPLNAPR